ncbi:MAG TPA: NAD-dependent epimerase [Cyanobacteria bacterium UBA8803]|nr:NAD-dependent epimerase [Cyanobacteria bacterium UBA9273]HBL62026.1 NAD-dependent epimerase [Cyanobacteria bacterium UBA8803]
MNVLLTSATGYIGGAIAKTLQTNGHPVIGIARSDASARRLETAGIQPYRGDLTDVASLRQAAQQVEAVIHTAATNDANMARADQFAVEALLSALEATNKPFIYTSGVWVMGDTGETVADETFPLNPPPIVAWRPAIEDLVLKAVHQGVRSLVIRPALVYGHGGGLVSMLMKLGQERGTVPIINEGHNTWSFVHLDDLATLYVKAMEQAPAGTLLLGASGEYLTLRSLALAVAEAAGISPTLQSLTLEEARQIWGDLAEALALDQRVSGDRAKHLLNWMPSAPSLLEELINGSYQPTAIVA